MRRSPTHWPGIASVCAIANSTLLFVIVISVLRVNNESFLLENEKMPDMSRPVFVCTHHLSHRGCWPFYNDPPGDKMNPKGEILSTTLGPKVKIGLIINYQQIQYIRMPGKLYMFAKCQKIREKVQGVKTGALGSNLMYKSKSSLGILNQAPDVPFLVPSILIKISPLSPAFSLHQ